MTEQQILPAEADLYNTRQKKFFMNLDTCGETILHFNKRKVSNLNIIKQQTFS